VPPGFFIVVSGSVELTATNLREGEQQGRPVRLAALKEGDHFAETALLSRGPGVATVTATSPTLLLFLSAQRFKAFERLAPEVFNEAFREITANRTSQLLKTIPLFDVLCVQQPSEVPTTTLSEEAGPSSAPDSSPVSSSYDERKLTLLASLFEYESIPPNQVVFHEGDRADKLYIVLKGLVQVSANVESGRTVLNKLGPGEHFGEVSLLHPTLRSATITTLEPCLFLSLAGDKFSNFLAIAPEMKVNTQLNSTHTASLCFAFSCSKHSVSPATLVLRPSFTGCGRGRVV
jgi:CRP-like cAMP-binding protein